MKHKSKSSFDSTGSDLYGEVMPEPWGSFSKRAERVLWWGHQNENFNEYYSFFWLTFLLQLWACLYYYYSVLGQKQHLRFLWFQITLEQNRCNCLCLLPNLDGREGSAIFHHPAVKKSLSGAAAFIIVIMHGVQAVLCWGLVLMCWVSGVFCCVSWGSSWSSPTEIL